MEQRLTPILDRLGPDESRLELDLAEVAADIAAFAAGTRFIRRGEAFASVFVIKSGWALIQRRLPDGTRQIVDVRLPGDFAGTGAAFYPVSDIEIAAKTDVEAFRLDVRPFAALQVDQPEIALAIAADKAATARILAERAISLGRRPARERLAHALSEFLWRLDAIGLAHNGAFHLPLVQEDFADLLGLSAIHANRMFRGLMTDGLIAYSGRLLRVLDRDGLEQVAGFTPEYLMRAG